MTTNKITNRYWLLPDGTLEVCIHSHLDYVYKGLKLVNDGCSLESKIIDRLKNTESELLLKEKLFKKGFIRIVETNDDYSFEYLTINSIQKDFILFNLAEKNNYLFEYFNTNKYNTSKYEDLNFLLEKIN